MKGGRTVADKFSIVKKGYDIAEVDEYINMLEGVVKSYKDKDAAIKNALISAQLAADNIIQNAKNRSVEMKESSVKQLHDILNSLEQQKDMLADFQQEYEAQIQKYLHQIVPADMKAIGSKIDSLETFISKFMQAEQDA